MTTRLTVLSYHNVEGTWAFPSPAGSGARGFGRQLDWLGRRMNVVGLGDALARLGRGEPLPRRAVAITFDDGYLDNLELAAGELSRRGMPATFFLVPGLIDRAVRPWWEVVAWALDSAGPAELTWEGHDHRLDHPGRRHAAAREIARSLKRVDRVERERLIDRIVDALAPGAEPDFAGLYMDADGARRLAGMGFEIGSHSRWHAILSRETAEEQVVDLRGARERLEEIVDRPVTLLAYPNGTSADYTEDTVAAARTAGYSHAVTTRVGFNTAATPPYELRRFVITPERGTSARSWGASLAGRAVRVARRRLRGQR